MKKSNPIVRMIFSKILWFLAFLILVAVAKVLTTYIDNAVYSSIINFFFDNLVLMLIIFFFVLVSEIFWEVKFPFNLPAPLLSAGFSSYLVTLIYRFFVLIKSLTGFELELPMTLIYTITFIGVVVIGYMIIINKELKRRKKKPTRKK